MINFVQQRKINIHSNDIDAPKRIVLCGDIVTMNDDHDVILNGLLCIEGKIIKAILSEGEQLPNEFQDIIPTVINGTIYPGLFDLHNHLPYNMIPLWNVEKTFNNRKEWQRIPEYYPAVSAPFGLLNNHKDIDYRRAIIRFTECRNLFGGVTTGHGMGLTKDVTYDGLMRNIEKPLVTELPTVKSKTPDFNADGLKDMLQWTGEGKPFIYHLSEGVDEDARERFKDLERATGALNSHLICIHCVGLEAEDFDSLRAVAGVVWSPTSNLLLYGKTCKITEAKKNGIPIAIGADWSPSGCKNILGELKVAYAVNEHLGKVLTERELVAAVTSTPAKMIGWDHCLGSIESGKWADLLILEGTGDNHYIRLIQAKETSIRAVIIDGRVRLAEENNMIIADSATIEKIVVGGKTFLIDLVEENDMGVGGITLNDAINKIQYGLENLPQFEAEQKQNILESAHFKRSDDQWYLEDEMHDDNFLELLARENNLPAKAMVLQPMTAVDDPKFKELMRASVNMPEYAKAAFHD